MRNLSKSIQSLSFLFACTSAIFLGGRAHAAELQCNTDYAFGSFSVGDLIRCGDKELAILGFSVGANATISFNLVAPSYSFDLDFNPKIAAAPISGFFEYELRVLDPHFVVGVFGLDSDGTGDATVTKTISSALTAASATSKNGSEEIVSLLPGYSVINVNDSWFVPSSGTLGNLSNSFSQCKGPCPPRVPGPLPLLGLGASFCWSRRLRNRIKYRKLTEINSTKRHQ
jgi:hypothetical protein